MVSPQEGSNEVESAGVEIPAAAVPGRRTPTFTAESMPPGLAKDHRTTVWAELVVLEGTVLFVDESSRNATAAAGGRVVIVPDTLHHIEPSDDAQFYVQFYEWGWKNFYDEDSPMATPEQVLELSPNPVFVSFQ